MADRLKIYFSGSIRGGREDQALYTVLIGHLQDHGDVLTEHVGDVGLTATGESDTSDAEIFARDLKWLRAADVLVAEVTTPSLGVGYEIALAELDEIPILCLYRELPDRRLSAMLAGNPKLVVRKYDKADEVRVHLDDFFSSRLNTK